MENTKYKSNLTVKTALDIFNNVESKENTLDLAPKYQRKSVWSFEEKSAFIDSLYRNIVPTNIILNNNKNGTSECIDGKQRITSIIEFKKNVFPLILYNPEDYVDEEHIYFSIIPTNFNNFNKKKKQKYIKHRVFTQEEKNNFNNINIPVVTYNQLDYSERVDIFSRIQNGKKLTQGENMAACISSDNICDIFNKYCEQFEHYFKGYSKINTERYDHRFVIACIYYIIENETFGTTTKVVNGLRRIKDNSAKTFERKMVQIDKILNICFSDKILKHQQLFGIDLIMDLIYVVIMFIQKNIIDNIIEIDNNIIETIKCLQKKYYKTKNTVE